MLTMKLLPYVTCIDLQTMPLKQYPGEHVNTYHPLHNAIKQYISKYSIGIASEVSVANPQHTIEDIDRAAMNHEYIMGLSDMLQSGDYRVSSPKMFTHDIENTFCVLFVIRVDCWNIAIAISSPRKADTEVAINSWMSAMNAIQNHTCHNPSPLPDRFDLSVHVPPICVGQFTSPDVSELIVDALAMSKDIRSHMVDTYGKITLQF